MIIDKSLKCRLGALYLTDGSTGYPAFFGNRYPANRFHLPDIRQMKQLLINDLFNDGTAEVQVTKFNIFNGVMGIWLPCSNRDLDPDPASRIRLRGGPSICYGSESTVSTLLRRPKRGRGKATKIIRKLHFFS